jgi:hypothetical protein
MSSSSELRVSWLIDVARASAAVANYCDHAEHNEPAERAWVTDAAMTLRGTAVEIAANENRDLRALYAARLSQIEQRNPLWSPDQLDGAALVSSADSWRALQLAQVEHDRSYHPEIIGLSKADQLRHCALHLAKLTGALAEIAIDATDRNDFIDRRVPDLLLFGLKLSTLSGQKLGPEELPTRDEPFRLVAG